MRSANATEPPSDSALRQVSALLGASRTGVIVLVVSSVLCGLCEAAILGTVAQAAGALVNGTRSVHADIGSIHVHETIGALLAIGFGLALARLALQAPLSILPARMAAGVGARLQAGLFSAYTRASWTEQSRDREGTLQELITNQTLQAAYGALSLTALLTAGITLAVLLFSALLLNAVAAVAVAGASIALLVVLRPLNQVTTGRARSMSQSQMDLASGVGQATRLAEETHVFGVAGAQREQMNGYVTTTKTFFYQAQMLGRLGPNLYQSAIYLLVVGGLALISAAHAGDVASLGAVVLLLVRAGSYGQQVQGSYQMLRQTLPFVERLRQAEQRYAASAPPSGERALDVVRSVAFENVSFAYTPGRPVLSDLTFEIAGGETIGIIGPSGAGKSTLVQLLLRLRAPDSGSYLVNGVSAEQFTADDWHTAVAYVPQEPKLLHASVAENIRYFRDVSDAAVEHAAQLARIHDDIVSWAEGYDTIIGPRADAVSGGQQQRICIARALVAQPTVLVLDEPTSALDPHSENLLQESLRSLQAGLTLFIIAHRMSTLEICDRVMVIEAGQVEAFDTAARLSRQNAYYRFASELASGTTTH